MNNTKREPHQFFDRFSEVARTVRGLAHEAYASFGVGSAQAKFLRQIGKVGSISQVELARATDTAPALTGRALETLIARGWIRRKQNQQDRRQNLLTLTAAGERARKKVNGAREQIVRRIAAVLDERDLKDFERIAGKILAELK